MKPTAKSSCHMQLSLLSVVVANANHHETIWDSDHIVNCWHPQSWLKQQPVPGAGIVAHQMIAGQTSGSVLQTPAGNHIADTRCRMTVSPPTLLFEIRLKHI